MGTYATTTSIPNLMPGFLTGNSLSDTTGIAIFSTHITRAEGIVNSTLVKLYSLPFSSTAIPPSVRTLSEDIASYYAIRGTVYRSGDMNQYLVEYKRALETLDMLRKGEIGLALTDGSIVPRKSNKRIKSNTENYTPIFGLDKPKKWKRDKNEIEDTNRSRE